MSNPAAPQPSTEDDNILPTADSQATITPQLSIPSNLAELARAIPRPSHDLAHEHKRIELLMAKQEISNHAEAVAAFEQEAEFLLLQSTLKQELEDLQAQFPAETTDDNLSYHGIQWRPVSGIDPSIAIRKSILQALDRYKGRKEWSELKYEKLLKEYELDARSRGEEPVLEPAMEENEAFERVLEAFVGQPLS